MTATADVGFSRRRYDRAMAEPEVDVELDPDAEAVAAVAAGDAAALELLYRRYGRLTYSIAYRISGDVTVAEECTQDAFLALWKRAADYDARRGRISSWLFAVSRNQAITAVRRRERRAALEARDDAQPAQASVDELAVAAERAARLAQAIADLPTPQLEALQLAYFGGLSQSEIAERLGLPLGTVKGRIRLALARLRTLLDDDNLRMETA